MAGYFHATLLSGTNSQGDTCEFSLHFNAPDLVLCPVKAFKYQQLLLQPINTIMLPDQLDGRHYVTCIDKKMWRLWDKGAYILQKQYRHCALSTWCNWLYHSRRYSPELCKGGDALYSTYVAY